LGGEEERGGVTHKGRREQKKGEGEDLYTRGRKRRILSKTHNPNAKDATQRLAFLTRTRQRTS